MDNSEAWVDRPAGFWLRWLAHCIDGLVLFVPTIMLAMLQGLILTLGDDLAVFLGWVLAVVIYAGYYTLMTARYGQTLGKRCFKLKVVRSDGQALSRSRAFGRWAAYLLSYLPFLLGFVIAAFTPGKRALHDYAAGTRVLRTGPLSPAVRLAAWLVPSLLFLLFLGLGAIAYPMFLQLKAVGAEAATRGNLSAIRSGVSLYYGDTGGPPPSLELLTANAAFKYMDAIPPEKITGSNRVVAVFDGKGGWVYLSPTGEILVNLDGKDSRGRVYRDYGKD